MHFDDRLTTVLAGDVPGGAAAVAQYRQLVDILGQIGASAADERHALGLARIHSLRSAVSESDRLLTVQCLSGRLVSPVLVQYLAAETPQIASAAIRAARLTDSQWAALVPALPTRARGFLRHRRDLGARTRALLDQLGLYDTALPDAAAQVALAEPEAQSGVAEPIASDPVPTADLPSADVISTEPTAEAAAPIADALQPDEPLPIEALASVANVATAPESGGPQSIGEIVKRIEALQEVRFKQAMEDRPATAVPDWNRLGHAVQGDAIQADAITGDAMSRDATQDDDRSAADEPLAVAPESVTPEEFRFSTGVDGAIASASGVALGAVYGLSLALPAMAGFRGVDAAVATAFSRRMPVRGGRANLGGAAGLSGEWRIDADPVFDRASGRFIGYNGMVRRPMAWESAGPQDDGAMLAGRDGLRQIVHELRTPLNAIMGFSEIIEQQLFGPVAAEYRDMALRIRQDARQLLSGFDDLDTALRLDRNALDDPVGQVAPGDLVDRLIGRVQPLLDHAGARLEIGALPAGAVIAVSPQAIDRIVPRLAAALIGSCAPDEVLTLSFAQHADALDLRFSRPRSLAALNRDQLFDVDRASAGHDDGGPLLGLGFCLRLVRNLLAAQGGELAVEADALCLTLPCTRISAEAARS
ncbi:sensor histidine kinase KdpD [Blastomonas sp. AAP25]|uniref:sensor histidine kinase n=1 Tax=Blastomonas sp. AAP25 TaxID=1523416 RepID=UPI0006B97067|nr:histidine kinase dimerization/phospho-acceptor domain-containing protein [Blastomonas sp. AAP25]